METEEKLIPYQATDLTGKKVLVLAPHPDDETIGCGGSLIRHTAAGDPVKVIFLTNGAKGDISGEIARDAYVKWRREEAEKACAVLGVREMEFWAYEDRLLAGSHRVLRQLIDVIDDFRPQLVYAPSPLEIHPDHRAASFLLADAIHSSDFDFEVAFYEIGQPVRVNLLVDITGVLDKRVRAMEAYESQLKERPYKDISIALNRYRSMTLSGGATHAEGFSLWGADLIRKIGPFSALFQQAHRFLPGSGEAGPLVSVIVRTKDRPTLLANALRSIAEQTYANLEIVVVNDGGQDVKDVVTALTGGIPVEYISYEKSKGRAAAANTGLKTAKGLYLNFLDDDDLFYPDHIETLIQNLQANNGKIAYTSVLSAHFEGPPERPENCVKRVVNHNVDFDPDRILFQNYIPIMSVLFHRDVPAMVGEFDRKLDLFEDWDFWIRASRHFGFHHVDKVTAEYRFYGVETTEASHDQKYEYLKAQTEIFDRITPFLTGEIWARFLNTDLFDQLRHDRKCQNDRLKPAKTELPHTTDELDKVYRQIQELRDQVQTDKALLDEIFSSKGWLWLSRFRRLKMAFFKGLVK